MMLAKSADAAEAARRPYVGQGGHSSWVTPYFGTEPLNDPSLPRPAPGDLFPVAFKVEEHADATLGAHFHHADQFQLFVAGDGALGKQPITPFSLHYADSYTPYGPIRAGGRGLAYLTLRNGWDAGPRYMPQSRDDLRGGGGPRRQTRLTGLPAFTTQDGEQQVAEILKPAADGLAAWRCSLAPHASLSAPGSAVGRGQYWVIATGAAVVGGEELGQLSCLFVGPGDAPPALRAASDGADVIILQFPVHQSTPAPAEPI